MILRPYKRIKELEEALRESKERNQFFEDIVIKEKEGLHKPNASCEGCRNLIKKSYGYYCKLDCKCADRQEVEQ